MPLFTKPQNEILSDMLSTAMRNTGVTTATPGGKLRSILEAMASKLNNVSSEFEQATLRSYLDGATGQWLDLVAKMVGIKRITSTPSSISSADKLIKFSRLDASEPVTIPAGTIISTEENQGGVRYQTVVQLEMPAGVDGFEKYVSVISMSTGSSQNVAKGALKFHSLTDHQDISVTNEADVVIARDQENDNSLRFRISNQVFSAEKANLTSIRTAALNVSGVSDVVVLPFRMGIGTFHVIVKAQTPTVPESLIGSVRERLYFVKAAGVSFDVRAPRETGISMEMDITLFKSVDSTRQKLIQKNIQQVVMSYLDNLDIGEGIIINELVQRVMAVDDNIKNMGSAGRPINKIIRWDEMETDPTKRISSIVFNALADPVDMMAGDDEKFFTETDFSSNPIFVNIITG